MPTSEGFLYYQKVTIMFFFSILIFHITIAIISLILGSYLFFFSNKPIQNSHKLSSALMISLILTAITGIFLETASFSPFHILVIVVLTTIPVAFWQRSVNRLLPFKRNLFYNFIGLNIALVGTLSPNRFLGNRLWTNGLQLSEANSRTAFLVIIGVAIILGIVAVAQAILNPKFFR